MKATENPIDCPIEVGKSTHHDLLELDKPIGVAPRRTAVLSVHGMGQQKVFETAAQVAKHLMDHAGALYGKAIKLRAVDAHIGEQKLARVELDLNATGEPTVETHVYEAYWAPLTEGNVTLRDVISFLFRAGFSGLRKAGRFTRTMFGKVWEYPIQYGTPAALMIALVAVSSLVVVNSVMTAVIAAKVTWQSSKWPSDHTINDLSAASAVLAIFLLQLGVILLLALQAKRSSSEWRVPRMMAALIWTGSAILLVALVTAAALMADAMLDHRLQATRIALAHLTPGTFDRIWTLSWILAASLVAAALVSAAAKTSWLSQALFYLASIGVPVVMIGAILWSPAAAAPEAPITRWLWVWVLLWWVSWIARGFLVQYIGDVAVYVEPYRVDRFNALRDKIRKTVFDVADAVYRARDSSGAPLYDRVIIVAHSLGSVVAYDTLNALMRRDIAGGGHLQITNRTGALITFGSPLDKTAFLFSALKAAHLLDIQEALANTVQPMIQSVPRPLWVNIYSGNDIISGKLDFYGPMINRRDPKASIPLAAHVEYWENPLLWKTLIRYL